jgi:hypothetical protein
MMDAKLFAEYRPWLRKPDYFYILKREKKEWTDEEVADTLIQQKKEYAVPKRTNAINLEEVPLQLKVFYRDYDPGQISMLWTSFWSEPRQLEQGWGFADMSEVNLVVAPSGQIEAYAAHPIRGMPGATDRLGILAKDLESYLEAMLCGQFNATHFISGFPDENPILFEKTVLVAKHCALIAGGYEYYDFWAGLLGLPPSEAVPD